MIFMSEEFKRTDSKPFIQLADGSVLQVLGVTVVPSGPASDEREAVESGGVTHSLDGAEVGELDAGVLREEDGDAEEM